MGQEISNLHFKHYDFQHYDALLRREMELLHAWFARKHFSQRRGIIGVELEAWLVDPDGIPTPWNEQVIAKTKSTDIVPELARYNLEFNVPPSTIEGRGIEHLIQSLSQTWQRCDGHAQQLGSSLVAIGLLPTLEESMLSLRSMSTLKRYRALNEQVLRLRQGRPISLRLEGRESLATDHNDVMLESATTSFQLHLQVPFDQSVRYFNASLIASAPMVAIAANAPYLFGKDLWDETRIPLFEQSVALGPSMPQRVTFGSGYVQHSLEEIFLENIAEHPILLPLALDEMSERLAHVRLLNGTIWRWNRPLIGFDDDGTPHLRIEHRVMPAGPTMIDMAANMAFYYGLVEWLAHEPCAPESILPFTDALNNFYRAARVGLDAEVRWLDLQSHSIQELILQDLIPRAAAGLRHLEVDDSLASRLLRIIEARARTGQNGARWQRQFVEHHGRHLDAMLCAYREHQQSGEPVHTWSLNAASNARMKPSLLRIEHQLPDGLLEAECHELADVLGQPTLIHLPGRKPDSLFVSIVLHGNEDVGLKAIQQVLRKYQDSPLPRSLSLFIGNVEAARLGLRRTDHQPDYNRIWPGTDRDDTPEHAVMRHVMREMEGRSLFASIDLHNNTGWNPIYSCICRRDSRTLQLASLFGRTAVYFQRPLGVQTMAFASHVPSVTCECGKVGDEVGSERAAQFVDACLHLSEIPNQPPSDGDLHLFHTLATLYVPERIAFEYGPSIDGSQLEVDLRLRSDLDHWNFQELAPGVELGWCRSPSTLPLAVVEESGRVCTEEYLSLERGAICLRRTVIPAMLTCNPAVVRQDCLGYLMERMPIAPAMESERTRE
jgi:gamma-glutamyl:cysteine ligase YbdK (ATP-grasp superfamily)